jgi:hypothetical protein
MHIYEYLFVGIIIISIVIASCLMMLTLAQPTLDSSTKDQLKVTAEKVMTQILLDPGFPFDWGRDLDATVQTFGLAKYGETSREAYMLDPDKVQRLDTTIGTAYLPPSIALQSLNMGNAYGFTLEISENLNVTVQRVSVINETFLVEVMSYFDRMPIANAKITGALYNAQLGNIISRGSIITNVTGYDGTCQVDFGLPIENQPEALIVVADYYGAHSTRVFAEDSQTIRGYLLGNQIITNEDYQLTAGAPKPAKEVLAVRQDQDYTIRDFATGTAVSGQLLLDNNPEPSAIAILAAAKAASGNEAILVAYRNLDVIYRSIDFPDPQQRAAALAYSLERTVVIAGTTYTATLYIWRMVN